VIIVPTDALSEDALAGVVDAFILREGTDYGHREHTIEDKRRRVHAMLARGTAQICYYPENEHIDIKLVE
jgi:uncharacterized protein YheU (UPF0270 family)